MTAPPPIQPPTGRIVPTCTQLFEGCNPNLSERILFSRFHGLDAQRRNLVTAWNERGRATEDAFEGFLYTWVAYNGWACCVTDLTKDFQSNAALGRNREAVDAFDQLLLNAAFKESASAFAEFWPIFAVKTVRGFGPPDKVSRRQLVDHYLVNVREGFHPKCWTVHRDAGDPSPCDWPHTLSALYRVRNNLFHGDKEPYSLSDKEIVAAARDVLVACLEAFVTIRLP